MANSKSIEKMISSKMSPRPPRKDGDPKKKGTKK